MKIVRLKKEEFDEFVLKHPLKNYCQSTSYGTLMSTYGFKDQYLGIVEDGNIIGATLLIGTPIFMGFKYGYFPHGLLINYNDSLLMSKIIKKLKIFLLKNRFLMVKMDPLIVRTMRDRKGNILYKNPNFDSIMKSLLKNKFIHCGFNNYLEAVEPRWHAVLNIKGKDTHQLFYELEKPVRNKLRKAIKYGIEIYKDEYSDIDSLYKCIGEKYGNSIDYYKKLKECFKEDMQIYFAKLNTQAYVYNTQVLYEKEEKINDYLNDIIQNEGYKGKDMKNILNKKMESDKILSTYKKHLVKATQLLKENPDGMIIGANAIIKHDNIVTLIADAFDPKYKEICAGYLLKWKVVEESINTNVELIDFNEICGEFQKKNKFSGLNDAKLGYNSKAVEYIGEFNLITNKLIFSLYRNTKNKYNIKDLQK